MATAKQIAANRANAQKSTGPRTSAGRAAVRNNALKHGLTSADLVVDGESEADFDAMFEDLAAEHDPATPTEHALVRQMAMAQWRLQRSYRVEAALFSLRLIDLDYRAEDYTHIKPIHHIAIVVRDDSCNGKALANISLYEARLERSFSRALRELQRLRAERVILKKQTQSAIPAVPEPVVPAPATHKISAPLRYHPTVPPDFTMDSIATPSSRPDFSTS